MRADPIDKPQFGPFFELGDKVQVIPDVGDALYEKPLPEGVISMKVVGPKHEGFLIVLGRPVWILVFGFLPKRIRHFVIIPFGPLVGDPRKPGFRRTRTFAIFRSFRRLRNGRYRETDLQGLGYAELILSQPEQRPRTS